ncbi:MAG: hypothetical protein HYT79_11310 [Elusimicrobia bacterium]|nr:hypothetical protein [Elusimicrobiota bacterium]
MAAISLAQADLSAAPATISVNPQDQTLTPNDISVSTVTLDTQNEALGAFDFELSFDTNAATLQNVKGLGELSSHFFFNPGILGQGKVRMVAFNAQSLQTPKGLGSVLESTFLASGPPASSSTITINNAFAVDTDVSAFDPLSAQPGIFKIQAAGFKDLLAPRTTLLIDQPKFGQEPVFINQSSRLNFNVEDDANEIGDQSGIGVSSLTVSLNSVFEQTFVNPRSTVPFFAQSMNLLGVADGAYDLKFFASDTQGNVETLKTVKIAIDNTPPTTEIVIPTGTFRENGTIYINSQVTLDFGAQDAGSGTGEILFAVMPEGQTQNPAQLPPGGPANYEPARPLNFAAEGRFDLTFFSRDKLGNTEQVKTLKVIVDNTPPTFTGTQPLNIQAVDPLNSFNGVVIVNGAVKLADSGATPPPAGQWTVEYSASSGLLPFEHDPPFDTIFLHITDQNLLPTGMLRLTNPGSDPDAAAYYVQQNHELSAQTGHVSEMRARVGNDNTALSLVAIDETAGIELLIRPEGAAGGQAELRYITDLFGAGGAEIAVFPVENPFEFKTYRLAVDIEGADTQAARIKIFVDGHLVYELPATAPPFSPAGMPKVAYGAKPMGQAPLGLEAEFEFFRYYTGGSEPPSGQQPPPEPPPPGSAQWTVEYNPMPNAQLPSEYSNPFQTIVAGMPNQMITPNGTLRVDGLDPNVAIFYTQQHPALSAHTGYVTEMRASAINAETTLSMGTFNEFFGIELLVSPGLGHAQLRYIDQQFPHNNNQHIRQFPAAMLPGETATYRISVKVNGIALVKVFENGNLRFEEQLPLSSPFPTAATAPMVFYGARTAGGVLAGPLAAEFEFFRYYTGGADAPSAQEPPPEPPPPAPGALVDYQATVLPEQYGTFVQKQIHAPFMTEPAEEIHPEGLRMSSEQDGAIGYFFSQNLNAQQGYDINLRAALKTPDSRLIISVMDGLFGGLIQVDPEEKTIDVLSPDRQATLASASVAALIEPFGFNEYSISVLEGTAHLSISGINVIDVALFPFPGAPGAGFGLEARAEEPVPIEMAVQHFKIIAGPSGNGGTGQGALSGTVETPFISLPEITKINNFQAVEDPGQGSIAHEFTTDGQNFFPIDQLSQADLTQRRIKFKSTLSRENETQASPALESFILDLIRSIEVRPAAVGAPSTATIRFIASERLRGQPSVQAGELTATDKNEPPSFSWSFTVKTSTDTFESLKTIAVSGTDLAGNQGEDATGAIVVDRTAPATQILSPAEGQTFTLVSLKLRTDILLQDNFDPQPSLAAQLLQVENRGVLFEGTTSMVVVNDQVIEPRILDDGLWVMNVNAKDWAGNASDFASGVFEIIHNDEQPPRTALEIEGPRLGESPVFVNRNSTLRCTSTDDALGPGDGFGLGVSSLSVSINGAFSEIFTNPDPIVSPVLSQTIGLLGLDDGETNVTFAAVDIRGHQENAQTAKIHVDNTPPVTEIVLPPGVFRENGTIYVNSADIIDFRSTDAGSGVRETVFRLERLNGNGQQPCPEPDPVTDECPPDQGNSEPVMLPMNFPEEGRFVLTVDATDNLGNHSPAQSVVIVVDNTPPTFSGTAPLFIQANDPVNVFNGVTAFNGGVKLIDGGSPGPGPDPGTGQWTVEYQAVGAAELPAGFAPPFQFLASIPILNVSQELTPSGLRLTSHGFAHAFYTQENFELNIDQGFVSEMRGRAMNEQTALSMTVVNEQDTALELLIEPGQGTLRFTNGDLLFPETATIGEFATGAGAGETRTYHLSVGPDIHHPAGALVARVFEDGALLFEATLPPSPFAFLAMPQAAYGARTLVPGGTLDAEFEFFRYFTGGPELPAEGPPGNGGSPGGVLVDYQASVLPEHFSLTVQKRINRFFTQPPREEIVTEGATMESFLRLSSPDDGDINYLFMQELSASQEYRLELRAALKTSDSRLLIFMQDDQFGGVLEIDTAAGLARLLNNSREQELANGNISLPPTQTFDFLDYLVTVNQGNIRLSANGNEILQGQLMPGDPDLRGAGFGLEARTFEPVPIGLDVQSFRIITASGNGGGGGQGTLLGTLETPFISLPELSRIDNFRAAQNPAQGAIQHEFTTDGQMFFPIELLSTADIVQRQIKFRSTLSRATTEQASPVLEALSIDLIRMVNVSSPAVAGPLSTSTIRFIASERLLGEPVVKADGSQAFDRNEPPSFSWTFKLSAAQDALEGEQTIIISGKDLSRNQGEDRTAKILIDRTPPAVNILSPAGGERFIASQNSITIDVSSVTDNFDPAPDILRLELVERQNTGTIRGPTRLIVHQGQIIEPLSIDDGLWVLEVEAKDWVNNSTIAVSGVFEVIHDLLPPRTSLVAGEPKFGENPVFITSNTFIGFSAVDDLVEMGDGIGLGVAKTQFSVDQSSFAVFSATFAISAEGFHEMRFFSVDVVGNQETLKTVQIAVDNTPPVTQLSLEESAFSAFGRTMITPNTLITLLAIDPEVNGTSSGWAQTEFAVDNGAFQVYSAAFTLPAQGEHAVKYRSRDNLGNFETVKTFALSVTPLRETAMIAAGTATITASGTADITGKIVSNGAYNASGNVRLTGSVIAPAIELKGNSVIIGTQTIASDSVHASPINLASIKADLIQSNDNGLIPSQFLSPEGALVVSKGATLTLGAGSYLFSGMTIDSQAALISSGPVRIFLTGALAITGGGSMNASGRSIDCAVFSDFEQTHEFAGGSRAAVILYAPNSSVKAAGNSSITGNLFAKDITIQGASLFVQADGLSGQIPAQIQDGEKQKGGVKTAAATTTPQTFGPDPKFQLGEVYAYPNPAVSGAKPVIHIEAGLADSARILIYSIAGELIKEGSLSGLPQVIDDGQGPQYAYEWGWDGHIPSGTYFYLIEAKKGSEILRAKGKFHVVR